LNQTLGQHVKDRQNLCHMFRVHIPTRSNRNALSKNAKVRLAIGGLVSIGHDINVSFNADCLDLILVKARIFSADISSFSSRYLLSNCHA
jgi:hypothetical protein